MLTHDDERTLQALEEVEDVYMPWSDDGVQKLCDGGFVMRDPDMPEYAVLSFADRAKLAELREKKGQGE